MDGCWSSYTWSKASGVAGSMKMRESNCGCRDDRWTTKWMIGWSHFAWIMS